MLRITASRVVIRGRPEDDADPVGLFVAPDGFGGWDDGGTSARRDAAERPGQHGEFDVPIFLGARTPVVDGIALARSEADLASLRHRVMGIGADGKRFKLTVEHQGENLWAWARRVTATFIDSGRRQTDLLMASFQLQFVCTDPRKYGELHTYPESGTATSVTAFHWGNFEAHPVAEIPNAPASYTVSSPGGTFTVSGATSGGTHRIDMRTGRVTRNGAVMFGVGSGDLWAIPAGARWVHTLSVAGRVLVPDTFV
jgi:hypothetical protein